MFNVVKRGKKYFDMFEESARNVALAAGTLYNWYTQFSSGDASQKIKELEHIADTLTHKTIEMLNRTFVTPIDREDIYLLITKMDDIIDLIDAAASRTSIYGIEEITPEAVSFSELLKRSTDVVYNAVKSMRNFNDYQQIQRHCVEIHTIENEADALLRKATVRLFNEYRHDAIKVIKWKEIYENLELATDRCEDVANIIESIALKYA